VLSDVVVASDGSEASDRMIECLHGLAKVGTQQVTLLHVFNVRDVGGLYHSLQKAMLPRLEKEATILRTAGFEVDCQMVLGTPFHEIARVARERSADLVVVGSLGASLVGDVLLGSTAHLVLQNTHVPILLVRLEIVQQNGEDRCQAACTDFFQHVLFPTDFSDTSAEAFLYLEHVVRNTPARVTLLHVQDGSRIDPHLTQRLEESNKIDDERLQGMKLRLTDCGTTEVTTKIVYGSPTKSILDLARSERFSLILMGSQGRGYIEEVFLGSVANNVARLAPLPALFVPAVR
jgi:nucleotide-binding universal stress UspA family protein